MTTQKQHEQHERDLHSQQHQADAHVRDVRDVRDVRALSDDALLTRIHESAVESKRRLVLEIVMLGEIERRGLHLAMAYSSMYEFCYRALRLSEDQAYRYMHAARLAFKFPEILDDLESGRLHLASLALLKKHVWLNEHRWLLDLARGKSKRELEKALATHFPKHDAPSARIQPLSATRTQLEVTLNAATIEKIEYARRLMAHSNPDQHVEVIIDAALDALIAKLEKTRLAKVETPRAECADIEPAKNISRATRRSVFERDGLQCSFVSDLSGVRCESKAFLELDHKIPRTWNGPNEAHNLRVLCRLCRARHNWHYAESRIMPRTSVAA